MVRWEPDSRGRLEQAAMALFAELGFDNTTVAQIAERAGLTERTFFRHFADKREVLFGGSALLQQALVDAVSEAPAALSPIEAAAVGLEAVGALFEGRREFASQRQKIVAANAELRERELIKLASLSDALAETLRGRGVDDPAAALAAEIAIGAFRVAFQRWVERDEDAELPQLIRESLDQIRAIAASGVS